VNVRAGLCALWLAGCATAAPSPAPVPVPARPPASLHEPAPSAPTSQADAEAEPRQPAATAPSPLQIAQPVGTVRLTGSLDLLRAGKPVRFFVNGVSTAAQRHIALAHPEATVAGDSISIGPGELPSAVVERHRKPSFLVDFDEPDVLALVQAIPKDASLVELRKRVAASFERVEYGSFWTASRAARNKAGDCTEHAVLLAAVARALGHPARVVLGYAVLTDANNGYAFGHAWTEIHDGSRWQRIDATPVGELPITYLILSELDDEGPGHVSASSQLVSILLQTSLEVQPAAND
jgi:hypothetical protein